MKKIHFENMSWNWILISVLILTAILIFGTNSQIFEFDNPKINSVLRSFGLILLIVYLSRIFWYKNYVQWNKKGIVIRIKSLFGKTIRFDKIKLTELQDKTLTITKVDGTKTIIDLVGVLDKDIQKLNKILVQNTISNTV